MRNDSYRVYKTSLYSLYVEMERENKLWKRKEEKKETKRALSKNKVI
jgi:hypothetical protein